MSVRPEAYEGYTGIFSTDRVSMLERIWDAWKNMRSSARRLIEEAPNEGRLIFMVLLSDLVFFLSWSIKTVVAPMSSASGLIPIEISIWLVAALMVRTAFMYLFSFVVYGACLLYTSPSPRD